MTTKSTHHNNIITKNRIATLRKIE